MSMPSLEPTAERTLPPGSAAIPITHERKKSLPFDSETLSSTEKLPPLRSRRSVSSMKGLMPLTLSPSSSHPSLRSSSSKSSLTDDSMSDRVDEYLPEVLARDLEISSAVFESKRMTAGAPTIAFSSEDRSRVRANRMHLFSSYLAASARVQSLGAIEERDSMVSSFEDEDEHLEEHMSESDSFPDTESSAGAAPPSFRHRGSVVTTATSLASMSWGPKNSPPPDGQYESSWIEGDSDAEAEPDREDRHGLSASPHRPKPTRSESSLPMSSTIPKLDTSSAWAYKADAFGRKSHSVSGGSPVSTSRRLLSDRSLLKPERLSTMSQPKPTEKKHAIRRSRSSEPSITLNTRPRSLDRARSFHALCSKESTSLNQASRKPAPPPIITKPDSMPLGDEDLDSELESLPPMESRSWMQSHPTHGLPASPTTPIRSVQSWLNSSLQPYPWPSQIDDGAKAVPLPPDVTETLRVSVACFPETMLLSSSLTIETIRSYARKVRHPNLDVFTDTASEAASQHSSRKSLWRKVVTYKRSSTSLDPNHQSRLSKNRPQSSLGSTAVGEAETPKPWAPIKNVFGSCSDYICDALYAHIIAYNYISSLVARLPTPQPSHGRSSGYGVRDSQQQEDVPKKAAMLLGLSGPAETASASMGRLGHRMGTLLGDWTKEGMVTGHSATSSTQDNALRSIQVGLLQCIAKLTATAKLMAESGTGEERMVDMEVEDTDMFFMRSLCEIVRMAEEAS